MDYESLHPRGTTCTACGINVNSIRWVCQSCLGRGQKAQQAIALVLPELRRLAEYYRAIDANWPKPKNALQAMVELLEKARSDT